MSKLKPLQPLLRFQSTTRTMSTSTRTSVLPSAFSSALSSLSLTLNTNPYDIHHHGHGESHHAASPPAAIVAPTSTEQVSSLMKLCSDFDVKVIPFGQGTSVEGHLCALNAKTLSLDLKHFKTIEEVEDMSVAVGAGVTRFELNESLR